MRPLLLIALATPLMLVACGGDPPPDLVVAPPSGTAGTMAAVPSGNSSKFCPVGAVC